MGMNAGNLDRRVQFQRAVLVDGGLSMVAQWANHGGPVAAAKRDISDAERWRAGEVQATVTTRFTIRWSAFAADLTPADRLIHEGRTFDIAGIKEVPDGRRRFLEITAAARADL
jgi:SPP1 family predicted phage head-tail adaptor